MTVSPRVMQRVLSLPYINLCRLFYVSTVLTLMNMKKPKKRSKADCLQREYNELADRYNKLIDDKAELERKNREKAYEVMYQQERDR